MKDRVYITKEGYEKLYQEMEYLKKVKRRELSVRIRKAREMGDISENAEYDAAKEAQVQLEKKIKDLEDTLSHSSIMDTDNMPLDKVRIGVKVELEDVQTGDSFFYILVSPQEANLDESKISINSPVAQSLLGKSEEDTVQISTPGGDFNYRILKISLP